MCTLVCGLAIVWLSTGCDENETTAPEGSPFNPETLLIAAAGFPEMPIPADNPVTREGVELGRMLFYDPSFSDNNAMACASCHAPEFSFTDHNRRFSFAVDGTEGTRNAPTLANAGWEPIPSWDTGVKSVEEMAIATIPNPGGMQSTWEEAIAKLEDSAEYPDMFALAFGDPRITPERCAKAIAQFVRSFVTVNSRYDKWLRGEAELTQSETNGYILFFTERGDCFHCHVPMNFSDHLFHNIGLDEEIVDPGMGAVTGNDHDDGKFKTPTLRNLAWTWPYMHDGRFETLKEVIDHYNSGGFWSPSVDPLIRVGVGLGLTEAEKQDLVAFLLTLTDSSFVENPDYSDPVE